jgi:ParB family chromosome partitioning protein
MTKKRDQGSVISDQKLPAAALASLEIENVFVRVLDVAPWNARKTFDAASLKELTESIAQHGIQVPLLARSGAKDRLEIVAGHRRFKAAEALDLKTVPCIVRELTDDEARERGLVDNLQREDLPPMEEAEAYGKLLERPGATIETVALALAKTPSYVGRRLQLLKAIETVRSALKVGAIDVGHALELARLSERMQGDLLGRLNVGGNSISPMDFLDESGEDGTCRFCGCTEDKRCPGGCSWANEEATICDSEKCLAQFRAEIGEADPKFRKTLTSVAELRGMVEWAALRVLSDAPFPLDSELPPMPCTDCPKRSTNAQLLFDDCAQDTCTDRRCFDGKIVWWIAAELEEAKTAKRKLLKLTSNWSSDKDRIQVSEYSGAKLVTGEHECEHEEEGIWTDGEKVGRRALVCRNKNCKTHYGRSGSSSNGSGHERPKKTEKEKEDRSKLLAKVKAAKEYRAALVAKIAAVATFKADALEALHIDVCCALIEDTNSLYAAHLAKAIGWDEKLFGYNVRTKLRAKVAGLPPATRMVIARLSEEAGELSVGEYDVNRKPEDLEKLARMLGVDVKKVLAGVAVAAPAKAEKPAKAAVTKPRKSVLSAAAKKRIAAVQKKRWAAAKKKGGK